MLTFNCVMLQNRGTCHNGSHRWMNVIEADFHEVKMGLKNGLVFTLTIERSRIEQTLSVFRVRLIELYLITLELIKMSRTWHVQAPPKRQLVSNEVFRKKRKFFRDWHHFGFIRYVFLIIMVGLKYNKFSSSNFDWQNVEIVKEFTKFFIANRWKRR